MAPPLGRQDSIISIEYYAKLRHAPPPPFVGWAEALSTQRVGEDLSFWPAPNFGPKIGLNLSEDLFFRSSRNFGQKIGLNLSEDLFPFFLVFT